MSWRPQAPPGSRPEEEQADLIPDLLAETQPALDDTVRHLRILHPRRDAKREEYAGFQLQAVENLQAEIRELRANQAKLLEAIRVKASKAKQEAFEKALSAKMEARLDRLQRLVLFAVAVFGAVAAFKR